MDAVDRAILAELQADGRLTVTELADRVRLTPGPCHRRLRELERSGVITGYRALVNPAAVGMGFEALVQVTLERGDASTVTAFETAIAELPQVRHAERLFGDPDYLLRVAARDLDDFAALRDQCLATLPGIHRLTSTIVMKRIVDNRPLPLNPRPLKTTPPHPHDNHGKPWGRRPALARVAVSRAAPRQQIDQICMPHPMSSAKPVATPNGGSRAVVPLRRRQPTGCRPTTPYRVSRACLIVVV
jgi:DNA-binding Lrp family transcriptional regulator